MRRERSCGAIGPLKKQRAQIRPQQTPQNCHRTTAASADSPRSRPPSCLFSCATSRRFALFTDVRRHMAHFSALSRPQWHGPRASCPPPRFARRDSSCPCLGADKISASAQTDHDALPPPTLPCRSGAPLRTAESVECHRSLCPHERRYYAPSSALGGTTNRRMNAHLTHDSRFIASPAQQRDKALSSAIVLRDCSLKTPEKNPARHACRTLMREQAILWRDPPAAH